MPAKKQPPEMDPPETPQRTSSPKKVAPKKTPPKKVVPKKVVPKKAPTPKPAARTAKSKPPLTRTQIVRRGAERELARRLQQARQTLAARDFELQTIRIQKTNLPLSQIAAKVGQGDQGLASAYGQKMILAVKNVEAIPDLPAKDLEAATNLIIKDVLAAATNDPLLTPQAKKEVVRVANELVAYAKQRGRLTTRIKAATSGYIRRVKSNIAGEMASSENILLRGVGKLLQRKDRKQAQQESIAQARQQTARSLLNMGNAVTPEDRESAIKRLISPRDEGGRFVKRGDWAKTLIDTNQNILREIRLQRKDAQKNHSDLIEQSEQDREQAERLAEAGAEARPSGRTPVKDKIQDSLNSAKENLFDKFRGLTSLIQSAGSSMGIMGKGASIIGAALIGWDIGRMIDKWTGASNYVASAAEWMYARATGQKTLKEAEHDPAADAANVAAQDKIAVMQAVSLFGDPSVSVAEARRIQKDLKASGLSREEYRNRELAKRRPAEPLATNAAPASTLSTGPSVEANVPVVSSSGKVKKTETSIEDTSPKRIPATLLASIRSHEQGTAGYDTTLGNGEYRPGGKRDETGKPITGMSLGEIYELQSAILKNPKNKWKSSAVGAYQFTRETLFGRGGTADAPKPGSLVSELGLSKDTKFLPEIQDQLAGSLIERRATQARRDVALGKSLNFEQAFQTGLSQEWASIQDVTGRGYYANQQNARTDITKSFTPQLMAQMASGARATAPVETGTAQLAQAQMQSPILIAANIMNGRSVPALAPTPIPVPIRPRSQDDMLRSLQYVNTI